MRRQAAATKGRGQAGRGVPAVCVLVCLSLLASVSAVRAQSDEGLRIHLPANGELQVSNWRGQIAVEVWDEDYISVTASFAGAGKLPESSPVVVKRTERLLSIGVASQPARTAPAKIDLSLRIPRRARARLLTGAGGVEVRGAPASLSVQTVSGDIRALFPANSDVEIEAESLKEGVTSTLAAASGQPASARTQGPLFQARLGAGGSPVRLRTERGHITLAPLEAAPGETPASEISVGETPNPANSQTLPPGRPPVLVGASGGAGGAGTPASPETAGPQEIDEGDIIRVDTELVTLNMSVIDRGTNRGLAGLVQSDFKLYEDNVEQPLAHFESSSAPFDLILLIDLSGSTRERVSLIRHAALRFINTARASDRIGVITFAGSPLVVSPLTSDRRLLRERVGAIDTAQGDTKLFDALSFTMDQLLADAKNTRRTAIVLMSDGLDGTIPGVFGQQGSQTDYPEILGRIREFDGVIYVLWLDTYYQALSPQDTQPEAFEMGHDRMKEMADEGGGIFYEVEKLEDLAGAYERVVADLGTVYSLSYRPSNKARDGRWRAIRVAVARPNAVARGKRGYYAK